MTFISRKMIPIKTHYKPHNSELFAIIKAFKTWKYYLKNCKPEVLMLTNYNNLQHFIDLNSLSFSQVRWVRKLSKYYF